MCDFYLSSKTNCVVCVAILRKELDFCGKGNNDVHITYVVLVDNPSLLIILK